MAVTGTVGGDVQDGDTVTLTVNDADLHRPGAGWRLQHQRAGSELAADADPVARQRHHHRRGRQHHHGERRHRPTRWTRRRRGDASRSTPSPPTTSSTPPRRTATVAVTGTVGGDVAGRRHRHPDGQRRPPTPAWLQGGAFSIDVPAATAADATHGRRQRHHHRRGGQHHHGERRPDLHGRYHGRRRRRITLDAITADNIINAAEADGNGCGHRHGRRRRRRTATPSP